MAGGKCNPMRSTYWFGKNLPCCLFAEEVTEEIESTGDESSFWRIRRNTGLVNSVMAAGKAWNAEVHIDRDKIDLQYFANETCVKRVTLSYRRGKWVVDGIGEACD